MAKKKPSILDAAAANLLLEDLLSHKPVAQVMQENKLRQAVASILAPEPPDPDKIPATAADVLFLKENLSRSLHWKSIRSYCIEPFPLEDAVKVKINDRIFKSLEDVRKFLKEIITGE